MKNVLKNLVILIIICILIAYSNISIATNSLNELENEKNNVKDQISQTEDELDKIGEEKSETLDQVEKLITQISSYQTDIEDLNDKISNLSTKIKQAEKQIAEDEKEYEKQDKALQKMLVTMYQTGETSYLDFMLSSSSIVDFVSSYYLISQVADYDTKMLEQLEAHKQKIEKQKSDLEKDKQEVSNAKVTLQSKQSALKVAKKEKEKYAEQLTEDEKKYEKKLQELQDTNDELDREIKKAQAAIEAARRAAAAAQQNQNSNTNSNYSPGTQTSSSGFIYPVVSKYKNPTTLWYYKSSGKLHGAVDFSGAGIAGTPVYAVADGYVVTSTDKRNSRGQYISYGRYILIAHYNGLYTLYAHMDSRAVSAGQTVKQGQVIGKVGTTGNSSGYHLHFEVRTGSGTYSERVYPMNYLP